MSFKLSREETKKHAILAEALKVREQIVAAEFQRLLPVLKASTANLNAAIQARNVAAAEAETFAEEIHDRLRDEWDDRSERWQEGDAGQEAQGFVEEWDVDISRMQEVQIVEPEIEGERASGVFEQLPSEPS